MEKKEKPFYMFKICILGSGGVGKTCVVKRLCFNTFDMNTQMTIGIDFYTYDLQAIINNKKEIVRLVIWDFGGQEQFKKLFHYYINGANAIFMAFSLINMQTLISLDWWYEKLDKLGHGQVPRIIIGTKSDLLEKEGVSKIDDLVIQQFLKDHNESLFFKTSSKDNVNIKQSFIEIAKLILDKNKLDYDKLLSA